MKEDRIADLLARREEAPGRGADWAELEPGLRRALEACSSLERSLASLSLAVEGHPERAGPWVLLRPLGQGPAGTVYLAEREDGAGRAAIRFLSSYDDDLLETARSAVGWSHEAVIPVLEIGEGWVATEVSEGVPLSGILASVRREPIGNRNETVTPLLRALAPVAEALDAAHDRELAHGGVSPRKIDLRPDGRLVLRDLGHDPTRAGRPPHADAPPLGPVHHLAPEQVGLPAPVGPATDVYAFATVVWTVVAGHPPRNARSLRELMRMILEGAPTPPPGFPPEVAEALAPYLALRPGDRPERLGELRSVLGAAD